MVPDTVERSAGAVSSTPGGVVSGGGTNTFTVTGAEEVSRLPPVSVARLLSVAVGPVDGVHA